MGVHVERRERASARRRRVRQLADGDDERRRQKRCADRHIAEQPRKNLEGALESPPPPCPIHEVASVAPSDGDCASMPKKRQSNLVAASENRAFSNAFRRKTAHFDELHSALRRGSATSPGIREILHTR
jgi:hypothetical protein